MRTIIAGSRTTNVLDFAEGMIDCPFLFEITEVISGTAMGADKHGENYAAYAQLPLKKFPAEWTKYGKKAGYLRNELMAENADALIVFWDGESKGTKHMIDIAKSKNLQIFLHLNHH